GSLTSGSITPSHSRVHPPPHDVTTGVVALPRLHSVCPASRRPLMHCIIRLRNTRILLQSLSVLLLLPVLFTDVSSASAQTNSGTVQGTVVDPSKAAVPGAKVRIENPVSGHVGETTTGADGSFRVPNLPFNPYHLTVTAPGFNSYTQDVDVRSTV